MATEANYIKLKFLKPMNRCNVLNELNDIVFQWLTNLLIRKSSDCVYGNDSTKYLVWFD